MSERPPLLLFQPGRWWALTFLGPVGARRWCHWLEVQGRSRACTGRQAEVLDVDLPCTPEDCLYCSHRLFFRGWVPALALEWATARQDGRLVKTRPGTYAPRLVIAELWPSLLVELEGRPLRGLCVEVFRPGAGRQSVPRLLTDVPQCSREDLPPAFDVRPWLTRLWRQPGLWTGGQEQPAICPLPRRKHA
jgi:hypothetical protein